MAEFGSRFLKKDEVAFELFRSVIEGEHGASIAKGWAEMADSNWLTEGTGVPLARRPVESDDEKHLSAAIEVKHRRDFSAWDNVNFEGMEE